MLGLTDFNGALKILLILFVNSELLSYVEGQIVNIFKLFIFIQIPAVCKPHTYRELAISNKVVQRVMVYAVAVVVMAIVINIPR